MGKTLGRVWGRCKETGLSQLIILALVLSLFVPSFAGAMTQDVTTAKSNETSTNNVLGGEPTRVTWEAVVDDGETVSSVTVQLPEGSSFTDDTTVRVTVLDGTDRLDTESTTTVDQDALTVKVDFASPLTSGQRLRVEMYKTCLPNVDGDVTLTGSYVNGDGETVQMGDSPSIAVTHASTAERIATWLDDQSWVQAWNSVTILRLFFEPQLIVQSIPTVFIGWLLSLMLVCVGFPLAIPLGLIASFMKISRFRILKIIAAIYTGVIRGTPLFLQIYIAFFGLPLLGLNINDYVLAVMVMSFNSGAYLCEIFRAGIQSIPRGQFEAARSLGMTGVQTMFSVIIPQTIRRVLPTMTSEFILLYKDTSLLAAVGVMEMMLYARSIVANTGNMTPYIVAAGFYLIVTLPMIHLVTKLERRLSANDAGGAPASKEGSKKRRKGAFGQMKDELAEIGSGSDGDSAQGGAPGAGVTLEQDARVEAISARERARADALKEASAISAAAAVADDANFVAQARARVARAESDAGTDAASDDRQGPDAGADRKEN
ncbi:MAG: ABC transporter permease subunit [Coriobacteriales bacterium]|jgi:polar amino acid transport system substrate-binding protein